MVKDNIRLRNNSIRLKHYTTDQGSVKQIKKGDRIKIKESILKQSYGQLKSMSPPARRTMSREPKSPPKDGITWADTVRAGLKSWKLA